jgi:signal peptidase I
MAAYLDSVYEECPKFAFRHSERKTGASSSGFQLLLVMLLGFASYLTISQYIVTSVEVVGTSMVPTLRNQDYYLLNRWIYHFREPQRFEVVVLRDPTDEDFSVKRIVASAGEIVSFKAGGVYVNGKKLYEPYLRRDTETFPAQRNEQTIRCGKDEFIVLGDNRENSLDSRYYGTVPKQNILGMLVY